MNNENNIENQKFKFKKTKVDEQYPFYYAKGDWRIDGVIFLVTALIIPLCSSIILNVFFELNKSVNENSGSSWQYATNLLVLIISSGIGWFILERRNPKQINRTFFYLFLFIPYIVIFVFSMIYQFINTSDDKENIASLVSVLSQIFSEIIILIIFFIKTDNLHKIILTFKFEIKKILILELIGVVSIILISGLFFGIYIENKINNGINSQNQQNLLNLINSSNQFLKWIGIISLFFLTIIIAPMCEELSIRHSGFYTSGNDKLGIIITAIYFGFIHYGSEGDFGHCLSYTSAGIILSLIFYCSNENLTYSWLTHLIYNSLSFGMIFIK